MNIYNFTKQTDAVKYLLIRYQSTLIDKYLHDDNLIEIYKLNNFFIEVVLNLARSTMDITPFKHGFSINKETLALRTGETKEAA